MLIPESFSCTDPKPFDAQTRNSEAIKHSFVETGTRFVKDGRLYTMPSKRLQSQMASKSGTFFEGRPILWDLRTPIGLEVPRQDLYVPRFRPTCATCGSRPICNGCSDCGACGQGETGRL